METSSGLRQSATADLSATRRHALFALAALGATCACAPVPAAPPPSSRPRSDEYFADLEGELGGRLGVSLLDTSSGSEISFRRDERFAMCSTFKWTLAAAVLHRYDRGGLSLSEEIPFSSEDLLEYAPIAREHVDRGSLRVDQLCSAAVVVSDNTAANLLLRRIGGPEAVTEFFRRAGDPVSRLDRYEPELNENVAGDERDTTSPAAMIQAMRAVLVGSVLEPTSQRRLLQWLKESRTGLARLRAGLPPGFQAGDKTGSGSNAAINDVAIVWPPGRPALLMAVYTSEGTAAMERFNSAHARIARYAVEQFMGAAG